MNVILDNGHGNDTSGKCSPDGRLREWQFNRCLVAEIASQLRDEGIFCSILVPETYDVSLRERIRRANAIASAGDNVLLSMHVNAAACSGWHNASGWSAFVAPKSSAQSRRLAALLTSTATAAGFGGNRCVPPCGYWTASLAMVRDTHSPAVLTENLFMDNRHDLELLLRPDTPARLAKVHVDALKLFMR